MTISCSPVENIPVIAASISFIIIFCGATGLSGIVFASIINRWFHKRLGLALGIALAGTGAGGFGVPAIVYLLDLVGLRMVFIIIGIAVGAEKRDAIKSALNGGWLDILFTDQIAVNSIFN